MQQPIGYTLRAFSLILTAACGGGSSPTLALTQGDGAVTPTPMDAARETISPSPTATLTSWKTYRDEAQGFEFQYPETCQVVTRPGLVTVGNRIELVIVIVEGLELAEYVEQQLERQTKINGWEVELRHAEGIEGHEAVRVDYRFGGTRRFGSALFLQRAGNIYIWQFTAGGFGCDEATIFGKVFASFRFTTGSR